MFCCLLVLSAASRSQTDSAAIPSRGGVQSSDSSLKPGQAHFKPAKSPWLAVGLSALAPGVGQIYDESYWKAPLIWGVSGYWVYQWISLNGKYQDFRDRYSASFLISSGGNSQYQRLRDFYHDERDKFAWFLGALYFLNLVDAYVGAHLYDFDVSPDLGADGRVVPRATITFRLML